MRAFKALSLVALAGGSLALAPAAPAAEPLRRTLSSYFLLAQRKVSLKNLSLDGPCNVGVNCASPNPNASCGGMALDGVTFVDGSQTVADKTFFRKPGAVVSQLFRNGGGPLANVTVNVPPPEPFATPVIPGSCDPSCKPNVAALETACGFPDEFPVCDFAKLIQAQPGQDCASDSSSGNGQCDLAPGTYGLVYAQNGARLNLSAGTYVICGFRAGRNVIVRAGAATVMIPGGGFFKLSNGTTLGQSCGDLTVLLKGAGRISFGRHSNVAATVCAPQSSIKLGHGNRLLGQFVGDTVNADRNNHALCCAGGSCACYNDFAPRIAVAGSTITLFADCDLGSVSEVRVCGLPAAILGRSATELMFTVPVGASGPCPIEVDSPSGTFEGTVALTVN